MSRVLSSRSVGWLLLVLVVSAAEPGCMDPAKTILVGRPAVFTRERLVTRRFEEQQHLEDMLAIPVPSDAFQGYRDVRTFVGLYGQMNLALQPAQGGTAKSDGVTQQQMNDAIKASETNTQQQVDAKLAAVKSEPQKPSPSWVAELQSESTGVKLPDPGDIHTTQARLSPVEHLRDDMAYRNAVQAALREQELDDVHDLYGMTMYTLKFDVTLAPPRETGAVAKVRVKMDDQPSGLHQHDESCEFFYDNWWKALQRQIQEEATELVLRFYSNAMTDRERQLCYAEIMDVLADNRAGEAPAVDRVRKVLLEREKPENSEERLNLGKMLFRCVINRYASLKEWKLVKIDEPIPIRSSVPGMPEGARLWFVPVNKGITPDQRAHYVDKLCACRKLLRDRWGAKAWVYSIEPKEQAQNISDVAATERLYNFLLSMQAMQPQAGVNAQGNLEYIWRSQERLHAILRKPLVVGFADYADNASVFGWEFGPRFSIGKNGRPEFTHSTVQHSVQVSVVVPAWNPELKLNVKCSWVDPVTGLEVSSWLNTGKNMTVALPPDYPALTRGLMERFGALRSRPFLEVPQGRKAKEAFYYLCADGTAQQLVLHGSRLWRNPQVFIGAQRADYVRILPDMDGLFVGFKQVFLPPEAKSRETMVNLEVVTAEGTATLERAVAIIGTPDAERRFAVLPEGRVATPKTPIVFRVEGRLPKGYSDMKAYIMPSGGGMEVRPEVTLAGDRKTITCAMDPKVFTSNCLMDVDLKVQWRPGGEYESVLRGAPRKIVYLTSEDQKQPTLKPTELTIDADGNVEQLEMEICPQMDLSAFLAMAEVADLLPRGGLYLMLADKAGRWKSKSLLISGGKAGAPLRVERESLQTVATADLLDLLRGGSVKCVAHLCDASGRSILDVKGELIISRAPAPARPK